MSDSELPRFGDWHAPLPAWLHREMALVGGTLYGIGGLIVLLSLVLSDSPVRNPALLLSVSIIAMAVGALFLWDANRWPLTQAQYVTATAVGAVLIGLAVLAGGGELAAILGVLYVFVSAYGFYYYPDMVAAGEVILGAVGFAIALVVIDAPSALLTWITVTAATALSGLLTARLGRVMRGHLVAERQLTAELDEASRGKTALLQTVSHDLRSPLTSVIGLMSTALRTDGRVSEDEREVLLRRALASAERMHQVLNDLLDMERIQAGDVSLQPESVRLDRLVTETLAEIDFDHHHYRTSLHEAVVNVEPARFSRVLENLISNAVRHTAPGTTVEIRVETVPGGTRVVVEDDGPGVPDHVRESLFQPFGVTTGSQSTGLGLSLASRFTELHGGALRYEDRPGGGARFIVDLPDRG